MGNASLILYLDFDGVLHPDAVYLRKGRPVLECDNPALELFCWDHTLDAIVAAYPSVQIKLSTSWVYMKSFHYAKKRLSVGLQSRVIGATFHSDMGYQDDLLGSTFHSSAPLDDWMKLTRFQQILADVKRNDYTNWLALDNDDEGWPAIASHRLCLTQDHLGIDEIEAQIDLHEKLIKLVQQKG